MKRAMLLPLLLLCASCDKVAPAPASPPKPDTRLVYELREKCGKDAREWFEREHGNLLDPSTGMVEIENEYKNHYNEKQNRCYAIWINAVLLPSTGGKVAHAVSTVTLVDVNENIERGKYFSNSKDKPPQTCRIGNSSCASFDEWQALAQPYMQQ